MQIDCNYLCHFWESFRKIHWEEVTASIRPEQELDLISFIADPFEYLLIFHMKHETLSHFTHTFTLVERFSQLPHDLYLTTRELVLHSPRVINLEFQFGKDRRSNWVYSRDHIERLMPPVRLSDLLNNLGFHRMGDLQ